MLSTVLRRPSITSANAIRSARAARWRTESSSYLPGAASPTRCAIGRALLGGLVDLLRRHQHRGMPAYRGLAPAEHTVAPRVAGSVRTYRRASAVSAGAPLSGWTDGFRFHLKRIRSPLCPRHYERVGYTWRRLKREGGCLGRRVNSRLSG